MELLKQAFSFESFSGSKSSTVMFQLNYEWEWFRVTCNKHLESKLRKFTPYAPVPTRALNYDESGYSHIQKNLGGNVTFVT